MHRMQDTRLNNYRISNPRPACNLLLGDMAEGPLTQGMCPITGGVWSI